MPLNALYSTESPPYKPRIPHRCPIDYYADSNTKRAEPNDTNQRLAKKRPVLQNPNLDSIKQAVSVPVFDRFIAFVLVLQIQFLFRNFNLMPNLVKTSAAFGMPALNGHFRLQIIVHICFDGWWGLL